MKPEEERKYRKKVGYITGIIGVVILLGIMILSAL